MKIKIEEALNKYKEGEMTIREGAKLSGLGYRKFLNELSKTTSHRLVA